MAFIPYEKFDIVTLLSPDEVLKRISANVGPLSSGFIKGGYKSDFNFTRSTQKDKFKIQKVIVGRNSFNPEIIGSVEPQQKGCIVRIVMKLPLSILILLILAVITILFAGVIMTGAQFKTGIFDPKSLIFLFALLFLYLLTTGAFKFESNSSAAFLQNLLEEQ